MEWRPEINQIPKSELRILPFQNDLLYNKEKICGILQEVISYNQKDYLIVGIGLNTNFSPKNKSFQSTSLKNMINNSIDNKKILKNIKNKYEKFLIEIKKFSYKELEKKYKKLKWTILLEISGILLLEFVY